MLRREQVPLVEPRVDSGIPQFVGERFDHRFVYAVVRQEDVELKRVSRHS